MKAVGIIAAVVLGLPAMLVGWAYLHRELFYRQNFAAAYLRHVRALRPDVLIDPASVRVRELDQGGRIVCGGPRAGALSTLAVRYEITGLGQREEEYAERSPNGRSEAFLLGTFCDH